MAKKQINQSAEVKQQESSLSTLAEQVANNPLPLPTDEIEVCDLCEGRETVNDGGMEIPCPVCQTGNSTAQPVEPVATALNATQGAVAATLGQVHQPAPACPSGPVLGLNAAEEQCPHCKGVRYFTEQVMNDEGQPITATVACSRCNGLGYILIPLYSPVSVQEKSMASEWPTESLEINWPWVGEPDPERGTIVGWNWKTKEVAVITKQPQYLNMKPWKVTIEAIPMPKNLLSCIVIGVDEPVVHKNPVWYATWTRTGEKQLPDNDSTASFYGRCVVQELA